MLAEEAAGGMTDPEEVVRDLVNAGKGFLFGLFLGSIVAFGAGYFVGAMHAAEAAAHEHGGTGR